MRFRCTALPDGGRLLSYANVSDLVHNADRLEELATTDSLTGLFNRRHFLALAAAEWEKFLRYARPVSLLIFDIDRFKTINDAFGHDIGDRAIAMIADVCRKQKRTTDVAARFGGEEFVLLLPETDLTSARAVAERIREAVMESELTAGDDTIAMTISIGLCEADGEMGDILDLIKTADRALYAAKRSGRNRTCTPLDAEADTNKSASAA